MRIKLHFPAESIDAIKSLGLRQINPETLRLVTDHSAAAHMGVILRGKSGEVLDGCAFQALHTRYGAWIVCDSAATKGRVERALATCVTGLADQITVAVDG